MSSFIYFPVRAAIMRVRDCLRCAWFAVVGSDDFLRLGEAFSAQIM
jgi:hypothetical protein